DGHTRDFIRERPSIETVVSRTKSDVCSHALGGHDALDDLYGGVNIAVVIAVVAAVTSTSRGIARVSTSARAVVRNVINSSSVSTPVTRATNQPRDRSRSSSIGTARIVTEIATGPQGS